MDHDGDLNQRALPQDKHKYAYPSRVDFLEDFPALQTAMYRENFTPGPGRNDSEANHSHSTLPFDTNGCDFEGYNIAWCGDSQHSDFALDSCESV